LTENTSETWFAGTVKVDSVIDNIETADAVILAWIMWIARSDFTIITGDSNRTITRA